MREVTRILSAIEQGDARAAERLLPVVYQELRKLASQRLAQEAAGHTLQATGLVHEAYIRLVEGNEGRHWDSRGHFFAAAAEAGCVPASTCWSRVHEQALKLALIYAVSEDHRSPRIGLAAAEWATRLALHSARRMAYVAHVREGGCGTPGRSSRQSRSGAIAGVK